MSFEEEFDDLAEWVAASLRAAAGVPSMQLAKTRRQSIARAAQTIQSAEETAAAAIVSAAALSTACSTGIKQQGTRKCKQPAQQEQSLQQLLPLLRFSMQGGNVLNTTITRTLPAACMQLTQLHLNRTWPGYVLYSPPEGLQQLRGLRGLVLDYSIADGSFTWVHSWEHLTKLHLPFVEYPVLQETYLFQLQTYAVTRWLLVRCGTFVA